MLECQVSDGATAIHNDINFRYINCATAMVYRYPSHYNCSTCSRPGIFLGVFYSPLIFEFERWQLIRPFLIRGSLNEHAFSHDWRRIQ